MTSTTIDLNRSVLIPAEAEDVAAMLDFRDKRMAGRRGENAATATQFPATAAEVAVEVNGQGLWRRSELEKVRDWISNDGRRPAEGVSYRGLHTLFDMMADAAGGWVTKAQAEEAAGVKPRQLQNEMSALTKIGRSIKGDKSWPIEWRKIGRTFSYRMDPQIAQWWIDGRKGDR